MSKNGTAVSLSNVSKRFGANVAVDSLSISIKRGEVLGFLGPNGAGKTTTMRMISGFLGPDSGKIAVGGVDVSEDSLQAKRHIGYLPENNPLYPEMLVSEYLSFIADIRGIQTTDRKERLDEAVESTEIAEVFYRPIGELSKGYRQRVGLAQAIIDRPEVLVLDEPTEGLDPNQRVGIRALIRGLGKKSTVILSTHVLGEVTGTCDRVAIIDNGRLVVDGGIDKILAKASGQERVVVEVQGRSLVKKLAELDGVESVQAADSKTRGRRRFNLVVVPGAEVRPAVFELAKKSGWTLWELRAETRSLESVFRNLTKGDKVAN